MDPKVSGVTGVACDSMSHRWLAVLASAAAFLIWPVSAVAEDGAWSLALPEGGSTSQFANDGGAIYAASNTRVLRSTDGGATWSVATDFQWRIGAFAAGDGAVLALVNLEGLRRSTDGGTNWSHPLIFYGVGSGQLIDIAFAGTTAYVAHSSNGVFRSVDGGENWQAVATQPAANALNSIAVPRSNPEVIYVGTLDRGVLKSDDGGTSWNLINNGLPIGIEARRVWVSGDGAVIILAGGPDADRFFRSVDAGASWQPITVALPAAHLLTVTFDALDSSIAYAGFGTDASSPAVRVYKTADAGATWSATGAMDADTPPDVHSLLFFDGWLLAGTTRGNWRSHDGGATWSHANDGFANTSVYDFALSGTQPGRIFATSTDDGLGGQIGVYRSDDGGASWSTAHGDMALGDVGFAAIAAHPTIDDTLVVARRHSVTDPVLHRSGDAGTTWTADVSDVSDLGPTRIVYDPQNPDTVYALGGEPGLLLRSLDGGVSWAPHGGTLPDAGWEHVRPALAVAPSDSNILYLGTARGVYRSDDRGVTWTPRSDALGIKAVSDIAVHPDDADLVYVGLRRAAGLFRSDDGGANWTELEIYHPVASVSIDPRDPDRLLVLELPPYGAWVSASPDGGARWAMLSRGLVRWQPAGTIDAWSEVAFDPLVDDRYYASIGGALQTYTGGMIADLVVSAIARQTSVDAGEAAVIDFTLTNLGDDIATNVKLNLGHSANSGDLAFDGARCGWDWGIWFCTIEALPPGESLTGVFTFQSDGVARAHFTVRADQVDPDEANNIARIRIASTAEPSPPEPGAGGGQVGWWMLAALVATILARPKRIVAGMTVRGERRPTPIDPKTIRLRDC